MLAAASVCQSIVLHSTGNHSSYFSINRTSGEITVARRLDRDSGLSRFDDLWVKVTDSAKHVAELSLDLTVDDVNDNKPRFESDVYTVNITGSTAPGKRSKHH